MPLQRTSHFDDRPQPVSIHTPHTLCGTYEDGLTPEPVAVRPGLDSGVMSLILGSFIIICFGMRGGTRFLKSTFTELFSTRRRNNAFDEHTAGEQWITGAMIFQTALYEGLLLYALLTHTSTISDTSPVFPMVAVLTGIAIAVILFQALFCRLIGYVFTDPESSTLWMHGFSASQSLLGFALMLPALGALFYPDTATSLLIIGAILYCIDRTCFFIRGFSNFYHNIGSLFYFIVYLCTLEIIPLILAYFSAVYLAGIIT